MNKFINEAINNGIVNYINYTDNKDINNIHIFEFLVIKTLVDIYGEINIINPYTSKNEDAFRENLMINGLKETELNMFFNYMNDYSIYLKTPNKGLKTSLPIQINSLIINMIIYKNSKQEILEEEILKYDEYFNTKDKHLIKYIELIVDDPEFIPKLWERKKMQLDKKLLFHTIKPNLLTPEMYIKYGLSIDEIKKLTNEEIDELNKKIVTEDTTNGGGTTKEEPKKLILTSGSGFVDTIVLLSIVVTEIMVGLIIAFLLA